jgi:transposase
MILPKLGIDQSKKTFDACLLCGDRQRKRKFSNDAKGFRALTQWLIGWGVGQVHLCAESTGRYGNKLAEFMFERGHQVSIVNPARIVDHRKAKGIRHKTDEGDALIIADYARVHEPGEWQPPSQDMSELRDLVGQIELLKKHRTAYANRSQCGLESDYVLRMNLDLIAVLDRHIAVLERRAMLIIICDVKLNRWYEICDSVPGIGPVNAMALVAYIDFNQFRTGRDLAVFLGLAPKLSQSGTTENRSWVGKEGNAKLRSLLRQGALSAKRGKFYKPFVARLMNKGKVKGAATNAVARKMLLIAHACIRKDELFRADYVHPLATAA